MILKISLSPSSPYLPSSTSSRSKAGVPSGSNPYLANTARIRAKACSRNSHSAARKSRVPDGGSNCVGMCLWSPTSATSAHRRLLHVHAADLDGRAVGADLLASAELAGVEPHGQHPVAALGLSRLHGGENHHI